MKRSRESPPPFTRFAALVALFWFLLTPTLTLAFPASSDSNPFLPPAPVRKYSLVVNADSVVWANCNPFLNATLINGTFPGPTIRARAGEILMINVTNLSDRNTTLHWHGLSMRLNPMMDGTTMVSQWPIAPGRWFQYRIRLSQEDRGTYLYHSHHDVQALTAYGALIIQDPLPHHDRWSQKKKCTYYAEEGLSPNGKSVKHVSPYDWDQDRVLAMGDYFHLTSQDTISKGLQAHPFVWPGSANALLLNGKAGGGTCNQTAVEVLGLQCPTGDDAKACAAYAEIRVTYDKRYRLRVIGSQALMYTAFHIFNHTVQDNLLWIIEADGSYLKPTASEQIEIATGQRYSVLLKTKTRSQVEHDGSNGTYWIRMEPRWRTGTAGWAKLVYEDENGDNGLTETALPPNANLTVRMLANETFGWITDQLAPLPGFSARIPNDDEVTRTVVINAQQIPWFMDKKGIRWSQNKLFYNETSQVDVPYLVKTFLGTKPIPNYSRAFDPANSWNSDPVSHGLVANTSEELGMAKKHHLYQGFDDRVGMFVAKPDQVIDIVIVNRPSLISNQTEIHPWHLHSSKHWTRTIQQGTFSFQKLHELYSRKRNDDDDKFRHPIPRDTTVVYAAPGVGYLNQTIRQSEDGGWAVLRYKVQAENAGIFLLHCHFLFHLRMGMAIVWAMAPDSLVHGSLKHIYAESLTPNYFLFDKNVDSVE